MDFYYAMTNYHVLCCLLHKISNNNRGMLYISTNLQYNQPNIVENIKESGLFEEVYFYDELDYTETDQAMTDKEIDKEIERICNIVEKTVGKQIKNANNLYICSDFYSIGLYLIINNIKYNYFEDGCGTISRPYLPLRIIEKENPNRAKIVKKVNAFGNNDCVIKRYANLSCQEENYSNPKDENFSVKDILKELSQSIINMILEIYNVKKINIKNAKAVLLLTQHYNEMMSFDDQKTIYTTLIDYFTEKNNKIIIKPHPADTINDYSKVFKGSKEINRNMPSELFPYCIKDDFYKGITCYSTSIYNLGDIIKKVVCFDSKIDDTYKDFDKYYAIAEFLKIIKSDKKINIIYKNINELQIENLIENYIPNYRKYFEFNSKEANKIYIVDKITEAIKNEKVISLDIDNNATSLIHINKKKKTIEEDSFISIYNIDFQQKFDIKKELKYSNATIRISSVKEKDYAKVLYKVVKNQSKSIDNKIQQYEDKVESLEKNIELKDNKLRKVYGSTSWKVTLPIRKVGDILRKIKNRL